MADLEWSAKEVGTWIREGETQRKTRYGSREHGEKGAVGDAADHQEELKENQMCSQFPERE